jgi:2-iminobutanoate/2-iminopropanoate deaminase
VHGGVGAEVRQALANMAALLESEGASLASVVKTTVFLTHMSAVAVAGLPLSAKVEIEAWAYQPLPQ